MYAVSRGLAYEYSNVTWYYIDKQRGFSILCIKEQIVNNHPGHTSWGFK